MQNPQSDAVPDDFPKEAVRRSPIERAIVWFGIIVLLFMAILEQTSLYGYNTTLTKLDSLTQSRSDGAASGVPVADLDQAIVGFCFRAIRAAGDQNGVEPSNDGTGKARTLSVWWPSLIRKLQLAIQVDDSERAVAVRAEAIDLGGDSNPPTNGSTVSNTPTDDKPVEKVLRVQLGKLPGPTDSLVVLATDELHITDEMRKHHWGGLVRELLRQSFLITARDELQLLTIDESLGEITFQSTGPDAFPYQININTEPADEQILSLVVQITRLQSDYQKWAWTSKPVHVSLKPDYNKLAEIMESFSRDQFPSALAPAGFQPLSVPADSTKVDLTKLESLLDPVSQFTLIRLLHASRRQQGDTLENLGALVRAYARLSSLVEYHWSPMSKVFAARSLLYAQRMQSIFGKSPETLAQRAYAWALIGNLKLALEDLEATRQMTADRKAVPKWLDLVDQYCRFKVTELARATGSHRNLALYLCMKAIDPKYDQRRLFGAIEKLLLAEPGCGRAVERMCEMHSSLWAQRLATEGATTPVWNAWYERLSKIADLPQPVASIASRESQRLFAPNKSSVRKIRLNLIESLRNATFEATSPAEPSWSLLGEIFSNENFHQAKDELRVASGTLGFSRASIQEMHEEILPGVKGHRFEDYLISFMGDKDATSEGIVKMYGTTNPAFFEPVTLPMAQAAFVAPYDYYDALYDYMDDHLDMIQKDLLIGVNSEWDHWVKDTASSLTDVCRYQPLAMAFELRAIRNFNFHKSRELEEKYSDNAFLLYELGLKNEQHQQYDEAIRCLKLSVDATPDDKTYRELAKLYRKRDDIDACIDAFKGCLKLPSVGLDHGHANEEIAKILMSQGKWKAARPYAKAAADTYSGWGLMTLAECETGLGNWKAADKLYQKCAERYEGTADDWYWWCVRTGQGQRNEAKQLLEQMRSEYPTPLTWHQLWDRGCEQMLNNDLSGAIETFDTRGDKGHQDTRLILLAAVFAERQGDLAKRDASYEVIRSDKNDADYVSSLERQFRLATQDSKKFRWHEQIFQSLIDKEVDAHIAFIYYCAGEFLANHGQKELALKYLQLSATANSEDNMSSSLAVIALRRMKEKVGDRRTTARPAERAKATRLLKKSFYYSEQKKISEAEAILTESIAAAPNFMMGLIYRGLLNEGIHDEQSAADYEACLKIDPDYDIALFNLAGIRAASSDDRLRNGPEALRYAQRVIELHGVPNAAQHRMLALAYAECGDFPNAVTYMEQAVEKQPKNQKWAAQLELIRSGKPYHRPLKEIRAE